MNSHFRKTANRTFKLIAIAEDERTKKFFGVIKFTDVYERTRTLLVNRADLDNKKSIAETLKNSGAQLPRSTQAVESAVETMANNSHTAPCWKFAATTGWRDGHRMYVRPKSIIGTNGPDVLIRPPCTFPGAKPSRLGTRGTFRQWQMTVADPARYSSRVVFVICAALAAPLLKLVGLNSFGVLISGPAKVGKSTMLLTAGSVIGIGREQDLPNFRSTNAALAEMPAEFNDCLLPLNELGLMNGRAAERQERLRTFAYGFAEGTGTTYSNFFLPGQSSLKWSCIALGTSEESADQIAASAGELRMSGEAVRCIDLPAAHTDATTLFDFMPKDVPLEERTAWAEAMCVKLRKACSKNHGVPMRRLVRLTIKDPKSIANELTTLAQEFTKKVQRKTDGPVVRHLARNLAHIYAAGTIGVRLGILPWHASLVLKSMRRCFVDARAAMNTPDDLLRAGLRIFDRQLNGPQVIEWKKNTSDSELRNVQGFWVRKGSHYRLTVCAKDFSSWFTDARQSALVLKWLVEKESLAKPAPRNTINGIVWAESQPIWPDGVRRRSIVVDLSKDLLKELTR
ncbi:DUF927 domain-containing protein [Xanthobacteraceae bacterium Astr-EGSB]|uniref:DUF927 domain-containing protein n=1 Tax=Astrobacterium formosum TaxID=3069710 RepID=UPI0027B78550|nr:DUF927 domain-containing protein [Xanthobacteraceae bacterium Astr-EGSB]